VIELVLEHGGTARILQTDGERVVVLAPHASPPGSTLAGRFGEHALSIKVRGCRRVDADDPGRPFRIEGRFVSLSRAARLELSGRRPE
jgi:hypothetical protein